MRPLVLSSLPYCNSLLAGLPACAFRPLQLIQNAAAQLVFNQPKFTHTTPLPSLVTGGCPHPFQNIYTCVPCCRTWSNITPQPVHYALHLPIGLLLPHCELNTQQNPNCLLSWLLNGGMSSPMTSGQQKVYTSSAAD